MLKSILIFEQYVGYWLSIVVIHFSMRTVIEFHSTESRIATSQEIPFVTLSYRRHYGRLLRAQSWDGTFHENAKGSFTLSVS